MVVFFYFEIVLWIMIFIIVAKIYNLRYIFPDFTINTSDRSKDSVYLVSLLFLFFIKILILFLSLLDFFIRGFAIFSKFKAR